MSDTEVAEAELPLDNAGARLLRAREAAGMSRAQACAVLRIPERHLVAIETGDYAALPARTYAVGFSRSYAKVVGLDPVEIVNAVRRELDAQEPAEPRRTVQTFEPGDPARVPGGGLVWLAALGIVVVLVAVFFFARPMIAPAVELPSILETPAPAPVAATPAPTPVTAGTVVFTATAPKVWVKFTDAAGNQLLQKELVQGESWTVPSGQADVRLATVRPDALEITVNGQPVPKLSDKQQSINNVSVTAAALLARGVPSAAPVVQSAPSASRPQRPTRAAQPAPAPASPAPAAVEAPAPAPAAT
ncbi:helix-turn-helix domain-containing protein [Novosphingobium sp.]|uniref:helix-turn-helix domain-containing protein n=1 Tax=Novosphingobium sp. TaxID=1874826 RepID=UPI0035B21D8F